MKGTATEHDWEHCNVWRDILYDLEVHTVKLDDDLLSAREADFMAFRRLPITSQPSGKLGARGPDLDAALAPLIEGGEVAVRVEHTRGRPKTTHTGFARTAIRSDAGFAVDNLDLVGVFAEGGIVEEEVRAGLFDGAEIRVSFVNWEDPDGHGEIRLRRGTLGETRLTPQGYFHAELRGLSQPLAQRTLEVFIPSCRADLAITAAGSRSNRRCSDEAGRWRAGDGLARAVAHAPQAATREKAQCLQRNGDRGGP